jgi:hypothetical protein
MVDDDIVAEVSAQELLTQEATVTGLFQGLHRRILL